MPQINKPPQNNTTFRPSRRTPPFIFNWTDAFSVSYATEVGVNYCTTESYCVLQSQIFKNFRFSNLLIFFTTLFTKSVRNLSSCTTMYYCVLQNTRLYYRIILCTTRDYFVPQSCVLQSSALYYRVPLCTTEHNFHYLVLQIVVLCNTV